jgi:hypothetical protein
MVYYKLQAGLPPAFPPCTVGLYRQPSARLAVQDEWVIPRADRACRASIIDDDTGASQARGLAAREGFAAATVNSVVLRSVSDRKAPPADRAGRHASRQRSCLATLARSTARRTRRPRCSAYAPRRFTTGCANTASARCAPAGTGEVPRRRGPRDRLPVPGRGLRKRLQSDSA